MTPEQAKEYATRIRLGEPLYWRSPEFYHLSDGTVVAVHLSPLDPNEGAPDCAGLGFGPPEDGDQDRCTRNPGQFNSICVSEGPYPTAAYVAKVLQFLDGGGVKLWTGPTRTKVS
jgi:hypothetical protein